ncbi:MAG: hypothetical protein LQ346_005322 [Caloplaca aetnensis]|nr:MAG: hypothetical protein LQ346_005322 [Caloplaca aetnensis]
MARQLTRQSRDNGTLMLDVPIDGLGIVRFGEIIDGYKKYSIATEDLNSCHAVAIVSKKAAVLGHIAPSNPLASTGEAWTEFMVGRILAMVTNEANKYCFEDQGTDGIVVFGINDQGLVLPDQVRILYEKIAHALGHAPRLVEYPVDWSYNHASPNKGTVFIEGNESGQLPVVWVEDRQVSLEPR